MNNMIILIILGVVSLIFLLILRRKESKLEMTRFISTLLATLIGVLLAVTLSNNANIKKEKEDSIKLLNSASRIVDMTYVYTVGLESYIADYKNDSISNTDSIILVIKEKNPLPYPDLIGTIISNELISKNMSDFSYIQINSVIINLKRNREYESINTYKRSLKELELLLELEIDYQKGEIDLQAMSNEYLSKSADFLQKYSDPNTISVKVQEDE